MGGKMFNLPRILAVIPHYGKVELTRRVHEDLKTGYSGENIIIIDNAAEFPYPQALRLPENVFWGGALELAVKMAEEGGFTHLWYCNNDIRLISAPPHIPRAAGRLARAQKILGREIGVYSPAVAANPYHPQMVKRAGVEFSLTAYVDGIAPVFSIKCLAAIGGLDMGNNKRGYGLDAWISYRANQAGFAVVVDHGLTVRHAYHTTAKSIEGFMLEAGKSENEFMSKRFGPDWRAVLKEMSIYSKDEVSL